MAGKKTRLLVKLLKLCQESKMNSRDGQELQDEALEGDMTKSDVSRKLLLR
jgi:hypothetical protein